MDENLVPQQALKEQLGGADPSTVDPKMLAKQAIVDNVRNATPAEIQVAVKLNEQNEVLKNETGQGIPEVEAAKKDIAATSSNTPALFDALSEQGADRTKHIAALMGLLFPVIAGVALGGKRGALHAIVGGGSQILKDEEREDALQDKLTLEAQKEWDRQAARDAKFGTAIEIHKGKRAIDAEFERFKHALKGGSKGGKGSGGSGKEEKDWFSKIPSGERSKLSSALSTADEIYGLASKFEKLKGGTAVFQKNMFLSGTAESDLLAEVRNMLPKISRAFGDVGNIAVAEQLLREKAIVGNFSSDGIDAAQRIRNLGDMLSRNTERTLENNRDAVLLGGDSLIAKARESREKGATTPTDAIVDKVKRAKEKGFTKEQILNHPKMKSIPRDVIEGVFADE
jgi:hypothetical protein